jgi:hypothetical protein
LRQAHRGGPADPRSCPGDERDASRDLHTNEYDGGV